MRATVLVVAVVGGRGGGGPFCPGRSGSGNPLGLEGSNDTFCESHQNVVRSVCAHSTYDDFTHDPQSLSHKSAPAHHHHHHRHSQVGRLVIPISNLGGFPVAEGTCAKRPFLVFLGV